MVVLMVMMMMLADGQVDQRAQSEQDVFHLPDELVLLLRQLSLHILGPASFPGIFVFTIVIIL